MIPGTLSGHLVSTRMSKETNINILAHIGKIASTAYLMHRVKRGAGVFFEQSLVLVLHEYDNAIEYVLRSCVSYRSESSPSPNSSTFIVKRLLETLEWVSGYIAQSHSDDSVLLELFCAQMVMGILPPFHVQTHSADIGVVHPRMGIVEIWIGVAVILEPALLISALYHHHTLVLVSWRMKWKADLLIE